MSSSPASVYGASSSAKDDPLSASERDDRNRTVPALISNDALGLPSWAFQILGPPVVGSAVRRPSTNTLLPFRRYWLHVSACLPQADTLNQVVSLIDSPFLLVY